MTFDKFSQAMTVFPDMRVELVWHRPNQCFQCSIYDDTSLSQGWGATLHEALQLAVEMWAFGEAEHDALIDGDEAWQVCRRLRVYLNENPIIVSYSTEGGETVTCTPDDLLRLAEAVESAVELGNVEDEDIQTLIEVLAALLNDDADF